MITGASLSDEERNFLCNAIIRLHKENGCLKGLRNIYPTSKKLYELISLSTKDLCSFLIEPIWNPVYSCHREDDGGRLATITASIEMLKFIDTIYNSKYDIFRELSTELIEQEFSYIKSITDEIVDANGLLSKTITMETIERLKHFYEKFKHLTLIRINLF